MKFSCLSAGGLASDTEHVYCRLMLETGNDIHLAAENRSSVRRCLSNITTEELNYYKLITDRTKQLHDDTWNGVRFFTLIQVAILSVVGSALGSDELSWPQAVALWALIAMAAGSSLLGVQVLRDHRGYYLEAQRVKVVIEDSLGLSEGSFVLGIPWTAVEQTRHALLKTGTTVNEPPERFGNEILFRRGSTTGRLRWTYWLFLALDALVGGTVLVRAIG